jgi:hypothetical protein
MKEIRGGEETMKLAENGTGVLSVSLSFPLFVLCDLCG